MTHLDLSMIVIQQSEQLDILASAIIAAGLYSDPGASNWPAQAVAHYAIAVLKEIKKQLRNDSAKE